MSVTMILWGLHSRVSFIKTLHIQMYPPTPKLISVRVFKQIESFLCCEQIHSIPLAQRFNEVGLVCASLRQTTERSNKVQVSRRRWGAELSVYRGRGPWTVVSEW